MSIGNGQAGRANVAVNGDTRGRGDGDDGDGGDGEEELSSLRPGLRLLRVVGSQYDATVGVEAWVEKAEAKVKVRKEEIDESCGLGERFS